MWKEGSIAPSCEEKAKISVIIYHCELRMKAAKQWHILRKRDKMKAKCDDWEKRQYHIEICKTWNLINNIWNCMKVKPASIPTARGGIIVAWRMHISLYRGKLMMRISSLKNLKYIEAWRSCIFGSKKRKYNNKSSVSLGMIAVYGKAGTVTVRAGQ